MNIGNRLLSAIAVLGLVAFISVSASGCVNCPLSPRPRASSLTVEDQYAAVWLPIDNAFAKDAIEDSGATWTKRDGVLFQLGQFWEYDGSGYKVPFFGFSKIEISGSTGSPVTLTAEDFTWLDINGSPGSVTLTRELADLLYPNDRVATYCTPLDDCDHMYPPPDPWLCDATLKTVPEACLRVRSAHAYFTPSRIVTYWHGASGYRMTGKESSKIPGHNSYVFELLDDLKITVWKGETQNTAKEAAIAALGSPIAVRIFEPADLTHGEVHDPPMSTHSKLG